MGIAGQAGDMVQGWAWRDRKVWGSPGILLTSHLC